jgi:hypothetical protein
MHDGRCDAHKANRQSSFRLDQVHALVRACAEARPWCWRKGLPILPICPGKARLQPGTAQEIFSGGFFECSSTCRGWGAGVAPTSVPPGGPASDTKPNREVGGGWKPHGTGEVPGHLYSHCGPRL